MRPGSGKTASTLFALSFLKPRNILIVAPIFVCETVWEQQCDEWEGLEYFRFSLIRGSTKTRAVALQVGNTHLINYELLPWLAKEVNIGSTYDAIVFDELSMMKSVSSKRFKAIRTHIDKLPISIGLTGTPTGNSLLGVWSQIHCVTGTKIPLGKTHSSYKEQYFYRGGFENREWFPLSDAHDRILERIKHVAFSYEPDKEYCPLAFSPMKVSLTPDIAPLYNRLKDEFIVFLEHNTISAMSAGALTSKLRQYESGFLYGENGTEHIHTQKIDATVNLIEGLNGDPLIIFYEFIYERKVLLEHFPDCDKVTFDEWNTGQVPVMLLHPRSAGHGLNLQKGGCNILFYTAPWSLELWQQAIGRLYRTGQERSVTVYHFDGFPVENRVIKSLKSHQALENKTFEGLKL